MKRTTKYVAFDVHQATTVASVRDDSGRVLTPGASWRRTGRRGAALSANLERNRGTRIAAAGGSGGGWLQRNAIHPIGAAGVEPRSTRPIDPVV